MKTKLIRVDAQELHDGKNESREALREAGEIIRQGGLVAFPTETVYGLGGDALNPESSKKIYAAKGRPSDNPLIIHIADIKDLEKIVKEIPQSAYQLADVFWPGPLTMILPKSEEVPYQTTGGLNTVAVRMPSHPVALEFIREAGGYVAAPSANLSGKPSPTKAKYVVQDMDGRIDMIIDGDGVDIGLESTIVDLTGDKPMILRPGYITKAMVEDLVGEVLVDRVVVAKTIEEIGGEYKPKAPGMKYRHYAPKAELTMYEGPIENVIDVINKLAAETISQGKKVGIIATDETKDRYESGQVVSIGTRRDEASIARGLYGILRDFDTMDVDVIYSETFYDDDLGQAIMNRLIKAAGYRIESV